MSIDKKEDMMREGSEDSMDSTPEAEAGPSQQENAGQPSKHLPKYHGCILETSQLPTLGRIYFPKEQKLTFLTERKGGRKPVCYISSLVLSKYASLNLI